MTIYPAHLKDEMAVGRIGVIFTAKDEVGEEAFREIIASAGAKVFSTRTLYLDDEADENGAFHFVTQFDKVAENLPDSHRLDILAFSCTSGTVVTGKREIYRKLEEARPGLKYTTPGIAALNALRALDAKSLSLLAPYDDVLHSMFLDFFANEGFSVKSHGRFEIEEDDYGRVSYEAIEAACQDLLSKADSDVVYISCTALDVINDIECLENKLGKPVLTSTQVFAWDCLRLLEEDTMPTGYGSLFSRP